MANQFSQSNYTKFTSLGDADIFKSRFKNLKFRLKRYRTFTVTAGFEANLPGIAHKFLGNQDLWWTILHYNGLYDPIEQVYIGAVLKIPDRTELLAVLEQPSLDEVVNSSQFVKV